MKALTVARKELRDGRRSPLPWALAALVAVYVVPLTIRFPEQVVSTVDLERQTTIMLAAAERPVVFASILIGALSVVGERESGSLRVLLGSSATRRDVVAGKLLGRGALLIGVLLVGLTPIVASVYVRVGAISLPDALLGTVLNLLLGLAYFGVAAEISTVVNTRLRALALSLGAYLLFSEFWAQAVVVPVYRLVHGSPPPGIALEFALIPTIDLPRVLQRVSPNNAHIAANYFNGVVDWFAVAMLVFWAAVPVGVGYLRFRRQEVTA